MVSTFVPAALRRLALPVTELARLRLDALLVEGGRERADRAVLDVQREYPANGLRLLGHDLELLVDAPVAERHRAADPDALALRGPDLVPDPLPYDFPFELREGEEDVSLPMLDV